MAANQMLMQSSLQRNEIDPRQPLRLANEMPYAYAAGSLANGQYLNGELGNGLNKSSSGSLESSLMSGNLNLSLVSQNHPNNSRELKGDLDDNLLNGQLNSQLSGQPSSQVNSQLSQFSSQFDAGQQVLLTGSLSNSLSNSIPNSFSNFFPS